MESEIRNFLPLSMLSKNGTFTCINYPDHSLYSQVTITYKPLPQRLSSLIGKPYQQKSLCIAMRHLALQRNRHVICVPYVANIVLPCMHSQFPATPNLFCNALRLISTSLATYSDCTLLFMNTNSHFISLPFLGNAHYYLCTKPRIVFLIFSHSEFHFPLQVCWPISYSPSRLDYIKLTTLSLDITLFPLAYFYTTHHSSHSKHDNRHDYSLSNSSLVPEISNVQPLLSYLATQSSTHPLLYMLRLSTFLPHHAALDCPPNPAMLHRLTWMTLNLSLAIWTTHSKTL